MKKFLAIILMLPICLSAIWLSGCKENQDFWTPILSK